MEYILRRAEIVTSNLETAGTWHGWNLCFYPWLNHTIMKILLYVAKIVDWGSFKLKLRDRLPIGSHTVRKPYHPSAARNLKQALFACEFLQGIVQLTWWILLSFHGRKYSSSRILWRSKSDLFTKPQAWIVQGHKVIYSEYSYLHLQCPAVRQFLAAHGAFGIGGFLDGHYRARLV